MYIIIILINESPKTPYSSAGARMRARTTGKFYKILHTISVFTKHSKIPLGLHSYLFFNPLAVQCHLAFIGTWLTFHLAFVHLAFILLGLRALGFCSLGVRALSPHSPHQFTPISTQDKVYFTICLWPLPLMSNDSINPKFQS